MNDRHARHGPDGLPAPGTAPATRLPVVLIVEDEPDQLSLFTAHFHRAGCTVIGLTDAEQALALPVDVHLDVMVLDLHLPGIDGWELTSRLRTRYPRCPVAITSVLDVRDYPAADWALPKPVTGAHIRHLLTQLNRKADHEHP
jgi:DNA-binding response OmpR family regulator